MELIIKGEAETPANSNEAQTPNSLHPTDMEEDYQEREDTFEELEFDEYEDSIRWEPIDEEDIHYYDPTFNHSQEELLFERQIIRNGLQLNKASLKRTREVQEVAIDGMLYTLWYDLEVGAIWRLLFPKDMLGTTDVMPVIGYEVNVSDPDEADSIYFYLLEVSFDDRTDSFYVLE